MNSLPNLSVFHSQKNSTSHLLMIVSYRDAFKENHWIILDPGFVLVWLSISSLYHLFLQHPLRKTKQTPGFSTKPHQFPRDIANVHGYQECNWPGDKDEYDPGWSVFGRQHALFSGSLSINYIKTRLENDFTLSFSQNWIDPICHRPMKWMILMSKYVNWIIWNLDLTSPWCFLSRTQII